MSLLRSVAIASVAATASGYFLGTAGYAIRTPALPTSIRHIGALHAKNRDNLPVQLADIENNDLVPVSIRDKAIESFNTFVRTSGVFSAVVLLTNAASSFADATSSLEGFTETESGLKYKDTKEGDGATPLPGDMVRVHYTGWLEDFDSSKKFDSSYDRGKPLAFKVGARQVISGWDEALLTKMKVGGKREIIIPPALGYGARGAGGVIPPNATLFFKIELVGIGAKANR